MFVGRNTRRWRGVVCSSCEFSRCCWPAYVLRPLPDVPSLSYHRGLYFKTGIGGQTTTDADPVKYSDLHNQSSPRWLHKEGCLVLMGWKVISGFGLDHRRAKEKKDPIAQLFANLTPRIGKGNLLPTIIPALLDDLDVWTG